MKRWPMILCASLLTVALAFGLFSALSPASKTYAAKGVIYLRTTDGSIFTLPDPPPGDTGLRNYHVASVENRTDALVRIYRNANCTGAFISIAPGETRGGFPFIPQCLRVHS